MKKLIVSKKYDGKKLNTFILSSFPELSLNMLNKALRQKDIRINGVRTKENVTVFENDEVVVYISDDFLFKKVDFDIVYEDDNILLSLVIGLIGTQLGWFFLLKIKRL